MSHTDVPTILIGLGGIGSTIANKIYAQLPKQSKERVVIHAFDTDVNTIKRLKYLQEDGGITQTSDRGRVEDYIYKYKTAKTWFQENDILYDKVMTEGAGQIRMVSRLAYYHTLKNPENIKNLMINMRKKIFKVMEKTNKSTVRIMIVSSLAGGTGSGIFLQAAMYLREMLEGAAGLHRVLVRGAFLLPDLFCNTVLDSKQHENVRANAYACMKELNAILSAASGDNKVTIELEYRPDLVDVEGNAKHIVTRKRLPYEFVFLYDYERFDHTNLTSLHNYVEQVSNSIYLQLFSPISEGTFSVEDNMILDTIDREGANRYCSSGVSKLIYPYEDIINQFALQWGEAGIKEDWLHIDTQYKELHDEWVKDKNDGIYKAEPKRDVEFIRTLEDLATQDNPKPFFRNVYNQTRILDERGNVTSIKSDEFKSHLDNYLERFISKDVELEALMKSCQIKESKLKGRNESERQAAKNYTNKIENNLRNYWDEINATLPGKKLSAFKKVFIVDKKIKSGYNKSDDFTLNTWILGKNKPLHPIAVRYFYYQIKQVLEKELKELINSNGLLKKQIENYKNTYDDPATENIIETIMDKLDKASQQGSIGRIFENKFQAALNIFKTEAPTQLGRLKRYSKQKLKEDVYTEIVHAINSIIHEFELFFDQLNDLSDKLEYEIEALTLKHENDIDPTNKYVLGKSNMKARLWEKINIRGGDDGDLSDGIKKELYLAFYHNWLYRREGMDIRVDSEKIFKDSVIHYCKQRLENDYYSILDLNIVDALKIEYDLLSVSERNNKSSIEYIIQEIIKTDNIASPLIQEPREYPAGIQCWAMHEDTEHILSNHVREKFEEDRSKIVNDKVFSKYEIIRYKSVYGFMIEDLRKFSMEGEGYEPGKYYIAYTRRINKLLKSPNKTISPHLDRRWHLPAFLPPLHAAKYDIDKKKIMRAFIGGSIYGWFKVINVRGDDYFEYSSEVTSSRIYVSGKPIKADDIKQLYDALWYNPIIVDDVVERMNTQKKIQQKKFRENIFEYPFYNNMKRRMIFEEREGTIFDMLYEMVLNSAADEQEVMQRDVEEIRKLLFEEYENIIYYTLGYQAGNAKIKAKRGFEQIERKTLFLEKAGSNSQIRKDSWFKSWDNALKAKKNEWTN